MPLTKELIKECKLSTAITPTAGAAGQTAINGTTLDMSGYEGVLIIVRMGAITATAVTSINAAQGAASDLSDAADLAGTKVTIADDDDEEVFYIDLFKPRERYVRVEVARATANAVVASAEYLQYGAATAVTTQPTGVTGESHVSPAEGTA